MNHPRTYQLLGSSNPRAYTDRVRLPFGDEISSPSPIPQKNTHFVVFFKREQKLNFREYPFANGSHRL
ncbi:hypothetical protein Echvi_0329 [Echinicola vietnamensis DSM 17526]|uniref:Uncharacterized protein n=1 Tax=Echinicola vietnamensis (strain DSM 17526 / LMG 23754 / KMM 6221) TaxID=926556 RepID=L0FVD6_ECHVK|nr:hypothetical protein Echvi_0329 [Echinicola vietnamensis DSM 17526]